MHVCDCHASAATVKPCQQQSALLVWQGCRASQQAIDPSSSKAQGSLSLSLSLSLYSVTPLPPGFLMDQVQRGALTSAGLLTRIWSSPGHAQSYTASPACPVMFTAVQCHLTSADFVQPARPRIHTLASPRCHLSVSESHIILFIYCILPRSGCASSPLLAGFEAVSQAKVDLADVPMSPGTVHDVCRLWTEQCGIFWVAKAGPIHRTSSHSELLSSWLLCNSTYSSRGSAA